MIKVIELEIDPELSGDTGVWEVAFVEFPAIEQELIFFGREKFLEEKFESYSNYPDAVRNNAKRGIELNEKIGNRCATQVGKVRAQQLANGEPVSFETVKRMYSYLSRAEVYYDEGDTEACGTISFLLWGGKSALSWSKNVIEEVEKMAIEEKFVEPSVGESEGDFISRCVPYLVDEGKTQDEALGACYGMWKQKFSGDRISFDFDGVLTTSKGLDYLEQERRKGNNIYIISARNTMSNDIHEVAMEYDIPFSNIFLTGSNGKKIEKIKSLGIKRHYDDNIEVRNELGSVAVDFDYITTDLPPYENYPNSGDTDAMLVEPMLMNEEWSEEDKVMAQAFDAIREEWPMDFERITNPLLRGYTESEIFKMDHKNVTNYFLYKRVLDGFPDRDFCMSLEGRYFRIAQIYALENTNTQFGHNKQPYSKWLYKGGPNCVHAWEKFVFQGKNKASVGLVAGKPGTPPKQMENQGYYNKDTKRKSQKKYWADQNMSKQQTQLFRADEEKKMLYTPLMIPNILIPRYDETSREKYYVRFSPETIEKIQQKFMIQQRLRETNLEHTGNKFKDVVMVESWLVSGEQDKAYSLGFSKEDIPVGTWMAGYKILDTNEGNDVWNKYIKTGKVKGASVEGNFLLNFSSQNPDEYLLQRIINIIKQIN